MTDGAVWDMIKNADAAPAAKRYKKPTGEIDRSRMLLAIVGFLVKKGRTDKEIIGWLLDKKNKISEHSYEQKDARRNVTRCIEKARKAAASAITKPLKVLAKEENTAACLVHLNAKHCVIADYGGKCVVVENRGGVFSPQVKKYFLERYDHIRVPVGAAEEGKERKTKSVAQVWWENPDRTQFERMLFAPDRDIHSDELNTWRGYAYKEIKGTKHHVFLKHIKEILCADIDAISIARNYEYMLNWMAWAIQNPGRPAEVALVIKGNKGTGKTIWGTLFGALFGESYHVCDAPKQLVGDFNSHLEQAVFVVADEAFFAGDKRHSARLKNLITGQTIQIESKGYNVRSCRNNMHIAIISNEEWVVEVSEIERRFFVLTTSDEKINNNAYFTSIAESMENGGFENLLYFLKNRDLTGWHPRQLPVTKTQKDRMREQQEFSEDSFITWFKYHLDEFDNEPKGSPKFIEWVSLGDLFNSYAAYSQRAKIKHPLAYNVFGRKLKKIAEMKNKIGNPLMPSQRKNVLRGKQKEYILCTRQEFEKMLTGEADD